jgi:phosphatidylserine/phosphatidylglycerophosphate/cardiolipin synthase-like enzyme
VGGTHEKILICDNSYVVTGSFNWLSYRPVKRRGFRFERAIEIIDPEVIEAEYRELVNRYQLSD